MAASFSASRKVSGPGLEDISLAFTTIDLNSSRKWPGLGYQNSRLSTEKLTLGPQKSDNTSDSAVSGIFP